MFEYKKLFVIANLKIWVLLFIASIWKTYCTVIERWGSWGGGKRMSAKVSLRSQCERALTVREDMLQTHWCWYEEHWCIKRHGASLFFIHILLHYPSRQKINERCPEMYNGSTLIPGHASQSRDNLFKSLKLAV